MMLFNFNLSETEMTVGAIDLRGGYLRSKLNERLSRTAALAARPPLPKGIVLSDGLSAMHRRHPEMLGQAFPRRRFAGAAADVAAT